MKLFLKTLFGEISKDILVGSECDLRSAASLPFFYRFGDALGSVVEFVAVQADPVMPLSPVIFLEEGRGRVVGICI